MTPREFYMDMWEEAEEFNTFLESKGMKKASVVRSSFLIDKKPLTLAIYPTASSGSTYSENGGMSEIETTIQMFCNRRATISIHAPRVRSDPLF